MFRTGSPYSPFFTSGFLSEPTQPSAVDLGPRRGSLPTDSPPALATDQSSAFYFTLQPQRDPSEFRSFLSLDLAESQSLRSASLNRRPPSPKSSFSLFQIPEAPRPFPRPRDSFRTIPSPKPAPSTTLPDLPSSPPRLPSFTFSTSLGLSLDRASHSAPPSLIVSRTKTPPTVYKLPKRFSTSTVSTRARKVNRSDALARLEGRSNPSNLPSPPTKQNFMSMSDDEDDGDVDWLAPRDDEPEDLVHVKSAPVKSRRSSSSRRFKQQQDWFPLKSFMDLRNDDDASAWSWRSWIEVASVS